MRLTELVGDFDEVPRRQSSLASFLPLRGTIPDSSPPIKVKKSEWEHMENPELIMRTFSFRTQPVLLSFIASLLRYERKTSHNAAILIEGLDVTISLCTHDLNRVTDLDLEYARECDFLFGDLH